MSQRDKHLLAARNNPRNVSLADFETMVSWFGYIEEGAKHPKAIIGAHTLTYKRENPLKACYVHDLLEIIDSM